MDFFKTWPMWWWTISLKQDQQTFIYGKKINVPVCQQCWCKFVPSSGRMCAKFYVVLVQKWVMSWFHSWKRYTYINKPLSILHIKRSKFTPILSAATPLQWCNSVKMATSTMSVGESPLVSHTWTYARPWPAWGRPFHSPWPLAQHSTSIWAPLFFT